MALTPPALPSGPSGDAWYIIRHAPIGTARRAGAIDLSLRRKGHLINPGDNFIAGICVARDLALATRRASYFSRATDLKVVALEELSREAEEG